MWQQGSAPRLFDDDAEDRAVVSLFSSFTEDVEAPIGCANGVVWEEPAVAWGAPAPDVPVVAPALERPTADLIEAPAAQQSINAALVEAVRELREPVEALVATMADATPSTVVPQLHGVVEEPPAPPASRVPELATAILARHLWMPVTHEGLAQAR